MQQMMLLLLNEDYTLNIYNETCIRQSLSTWRVLTLLQRKQIIVIQFLNNAKINISFQLSTHMYTYTHNILSYLYNYADKQLGNFSIIWLVQVDFFSILVCTMYKFVQRVQNLVNICDVNEYTFSTTAIRSTSWSKKRTIYM